MILQALLLALLPLKAAAETPAVIGAHKAPVFFLAYQEGGLLLSAAADGARAWDPRAGKLLGEMPLPGTAAAAWSGRAGLLALAAGDGEIVLYSSGTWTETARLYSPGGSLSVFFSSDGARLAAAGADGYTRIWSAPGWEAPREFRTAGGPFRLGGFLRGGELVSFAPGEPLLRLWDPSTGRFLRALRSPHTLAAFPAPAGGDLAVLSAGSGLNLLDAYGDSPPAKACPAPARAAALSQGGSLAACAAPGGALVAAAYGGGERGRAACPGRGASALAFSPGAAHLACGGADGAVSVAQWASEAWTSTGPAAVKGALGGTVTALPAGFRVGLGAAAPGAGHWPVRDGTGLAGWVRAEELTAEGPLRPPLVRVSTWTLAGGRLFAAGSVSGDGRLAYVRLAGRGLPRAGPAPASGHDHWEFSGWAEVSPDIPPLIEAADRAGGSVAVPLAAPSALSYDPAYSLLRPRHRARIYSSPDAGARPLAAAGDSPLAALGRRGGWYALEGGGWLKASDAEKAEARWAPEPPPAAPGPQEPPAEEAVPSGPSNPRGLAVVIGVKDHTGGVPPADYALEDAAAVRRHLVTALGFDEDKVFLLQNPTKGQLETFFGADGRLSRLVRPGETELFVYYSGHGAADPAAGESYLVPADARPEYLREGGYKLERLYGELYAAGAARVTVVLEACFSGLSHGGPLAASASPLVLAGARPPSEGLNILSSSAADQISSWFPAERRGLFTYHLLKALRENCCSGKPLRLGPLHDAAAAGTRAAALRLYGREQTPLFSGDRDSIIAR